MFRLCLIGIVAAIVFGLMSFLPVIGVVFKVLAIIGVVVAGLSLVIGLIKLLFFSWW